MYLIVWQNVSAHWMVSDCILIFSKFIFLVSALFITYTFQRLKLERIPFDVQIILISRKFGNNNSIGMVATKRQDVLCNEKVLFLVDSKKWVYTLIYRCLVRRYDCKFRSYYMFALQEKALIF